MDIVTDFHIFRLIFMIIAIDIVCFPCDFVLIAYFKTNFIFRKE